MKISFFLAKRYLKKHGSTTLIHRLSKLACYSMAVSTAILLLILSTMNGMEKLLSTLFYAYTPTLKIASQTGKTFVYDPKLKSNIMGVVGVAAIVEVLEATALVRLHGQQAIVTIKGVSSNFTASDFYKNCTRMDAVAFWEEDRPRAIAGIQVAQWLQWAPHSNRVEVFYPKQGSYHLQSPYKRMTLDVNGLFAIAKQIDRSYMIAPIHFVESLTDGWHKRSYWEVVINDRADLATIQTTIQKLLPDGYEATNRDEQNQTRLRAIFIERLSVSFIFALVLLLASLHIFFMLCMLIVHKQKDIAILASLGATPGQIGKIFFYNGLLVSLKGMVYGLIIGCVLGFLQQKFGLVTFIRSGRRSPYPIAMHGVDGLYTAMATILFSFLASLWPAKRAMQLASKLLKR